MGITDANMVTSKLTSKYQATIPAEIRRKLKLHAGDTLRFEVVEGVVRLHRATPLDVQFAQALTDTLIEWNSDNDNTAYRDL